MGVQPAGGSLQTAVARSRQYKATAGRNGFIPKMDQPVDDTGYYLLVFNQTFYGIPYYGHMLFIYPSKNDRKGGYPLGDLHFSVFSPDAYVYSIHPSVEQAVLAEDVPLCSLETCIKALINSGRNSDQTPTKLKLGYYSFNDPNDRNGDHLILVPVWVMDRVPLLMWMSLFDLIAFTSLPLEVMVNSPPLMVMRESHFRAETSSPVRVMSSLPPLMNN